MSSITTKSGDSGDTALMYGVRLAKTDLRVEAYGTVDEFTSALGVAKAATRDPEIKETTHSIQKELIALMGELATAEKDHERYTKHFGIVSAEMVDRIHDLILDLEQKHPRSSKEWAIPGANPAAAAWDLARTVCRRAERCVIRSEEVFGIMNPEIRRYLNRLSDLCWLYARRLEADPSAVD